MPPKKSETPDTPKTLEKSKTPVKAKKPGKALTIENLILLGVEQLAELLLDISKGNAVSQRILRTALAGAVGFEEASKEIRKRINSLARTKTYIDSAKKKTLLKELEGLKNQILKQVLPNNAIEATDLMWSLLRLWNDIIERSTDENDAIYDFFKGIMRELAQCSLLAKEKPFILAERIYNDILDSDYGQYHDLIPTMAKALAKEGLELLRTKLQDKNIDTRKAYLVKRALKYVALALNKVDDYIALKSVYELKVPKTTAHIAFLLLESGRHKDAERILNKADCERYDDECDEWAQAKVALFEAMGKLDEAQNFRYDFFKKTLSVDMLKAYLKQLPEFKDFEAEQQALDYVKTFENVHHGMYFLIQWHAPKQLNDMVFNRYDEIDGNLYALLPMASKVLEAQYPLSAVLIMRKLIDDTLNYAKSSRYKHTAKHLAECILLAQYISDYQGYMKHDDYLVSLKKTHGKKYSFWEYMK